MTHWWREYGKICIVTLVPDFIISSRDLFGPDLEYGVTRGERILDIESHHWKSETGTEEIWSESDSDSSNSKESDRDYASEDGQDVFARAGSR